MEIVNDWLVLVHITEKTDEVFCQKLASTICKYNNIALFKAQNDEKMPYWVEKLVETKCVLDCCGNVANLMGKKVVVVADPLHLDTKKILYEIYTTIENAVLLESPKQVSPSLQTFEKEFPEWDMPFSLIMGKETWRRNWAEKRKQKKEEEPLSVWRAFYSGARYIGPNVYVIVKMGDGQRVQLMKPGNTIAETVALAVDSINPPCFYVKSVGLYNWNKNKFEGWIEYIYVVLEMKRGMSLPQYCLPSPSLAQTKWTM